MANDPVRTAGTLTGARLPLSLEQRGYLGLGRKGYGTIAACSDITGPVRIDVLNDAVREVVRRHEPLRMRMRHDAEGAGQFFVDPDLVPAQWEVVPVPAGYDLDDHLGRELDPQRDGAIRLLMLKDGEDHAFALALLDHMACDGFGARVFLSDLWLAYRAIAAGGRPALPPLTRTYADHIRAQQAAAGRAERVRGSWEALAERFARSATGLPGPRGQAEAGRGRSDIAAVVQPEHARRAGELARALGVSPNTLPLAGLVLAAASIAERDCVGISFIYAGRDVAGSKSLVGAFHRHVALLTERITEGTLGEFVSGVSRGVFEALRRSRAPYSASDFDAAVRSHRDTPVVDVLYNQVSEFFGRPGDSEPLKVDDHTAVTFPGVHFRPARWRSYQEPRLRMVAGGGAQPVLRLIFNQGLVAEDHARLLLDRTLAMLESMTPEAAGSRVPEFISSAIARRDA